MRGLRWAFWGALLLAGGAEAAAPGRPVRAQVDARACKIGHPVVLSLRVARQPGEQVRWHLADEAVQNKEGLLLQAQTRTLGAAELQHRMVFTSAQGGRCQLGPFAVVLQGRQGVDTVYAPAIAVQFQAEPLRRELHALRPVVPAWQAVPAPRKWALLASAVLLAGAGGAAWQLLRKRPPQPTEPPQPPTLDQARQLALDKMEALEMHSQLHAHAAMPDELVGIVREYLECRADAERNAEPLADAAGLAELDRARFAPAPPDAAGRARLLALARQLVLSGAETGVVLTETLVR
ncbi:hypothetical protein JAO73_15335 [Hymenobacter sp. BT523]|uniref:hypothetical protein n=1 Tax=Hymenobacter sp. BT523 TaxID=2795725 RepID=UPI0018EDB4C9|nr:hypothetical protein [Hymenobacter sp. BT523]MBJ6110396.1 hypothetical protein [Hymenobacter sp. BT523]